MKLEEKVDLLNEKREVMKEKGGKQEKEKKKSCRLPVRTSLHFRYTYIHIYIYSNTFVRKVTDSRYFLLPGKLAVFSYKISRILFYRIGIVSSESNKQDSIPPTLNSSFHWIMHSGFCSRSRTPEVQFSYGVKIFTQSVRGFWFLSQHGCLSAYVCGLVSHLRIPIASYLPFAKFCHISFPIHEVLSRLISHLV
jgi:hypothetical protein